MSNTFVGQTDSSIAYSEPSHGRHSLPCLLDSQHRLSTYVCCVYIPTRNLHRVFVWTSQRPRGRMHTASKTFKDIKSLRKMLDDTDIDTSSAFTSTSFSNNISSFVTTSTLSGRPISDDSWHEIEQYTKTVMADGQSCTFTIVYEPVLQMATLRIFLTRLAIRETHAHVNNVYTYVYIETEQDVVTYVHDLINVVLAIQGTLTSRVYRRQQTLRLNLLKCSIPWTSKMWDKLNQYVEQCTLHKDHPIEQEKWFKYLERLFLIHIQQKEKPIRHRIDFTEDRLVVPFHVQHARSSRYGFFQQGTNDLHTRNKAIDWLMGELPSCILYATQTATAAPSESQIDTLYTQTLLPATLNALSNKSHDINNFLFQTRNGTLRAYLNRSRIELQLYQVYNQIQTSKKFPIFALYNQTPGLKRRILRTKYYEHTLNDNSTTNLKLTPGDTVFDAYLRHVDSHDSSIWLEHYSQDVAHYLDVVVYVNHHYYLCILDRRGVINVQLVPWLTKKSNNNYKSTSSLSYSLQKVVETLVPVLNKWIDIVNQCSYSVVASPYNSGPFLMHLDMWKLNDLTYASPNIHIHKYDVQSQFSAPRACVIEGLRTLAYSFIPSSVNSPALINNPPSSLHQLWTRLGHSNTNSKLINQLLSGQSISHISIDDHLALDRLFAKNNKITKSTLLSNSGVSRFHIDDRYGYDILKHGIPLTLTVEADSVQWKAEPYSNLQSTTTVQDGTNIYHSPSLLVSPSILHEFAILFANSTLCYKKTHAWKALYTALLNQTILKKNVKNDDVEVMCPIPILSAPHGNRLHNIKETLGIELYKQHVSKCTNKGHYARICQTANQPWCVPASTSATFRIWCRYACVPSTFDYWMRHSVRELLQINTKQTVFRGPYRIQYKTCEQHKHLVHNMFKMQNLPFSESVCDILKTTLLRLMIEVHQRTYPDSKLSSKTDISDEIGLELFKKGVTDKKLIINAMLFYDEVFNDEPLPDFSKWRCLYGYVQAAWRMWIHICQRFAQTLYYLPHPTVTTCTREPIHFCCPVYICATCKIPMADPETPQEYYADPPTDDELTVAIKYASMYYQNSPIVSVAIRKRTQSSKSLMDYMYGDFSSSGVQELLWAYNAIKPEPVVLKQYTHDDVYGLFQTLLSFDTLKDMSLTTCITHSGEYEVFYSVIDSDESKNKWSFKRITSTISKHDSNQCLVYRCNKGHYIVTTDDYPLSSTDYVVCTDVPETFQATIHILHIRADKSSRIPNMSFTLDTQTKLPPYLVLRENDHTATIVSKEDIPLCIRFRQFRAFDPFKSIFVPADFIETKMSDSIFITFRGIVSYEESRTKRTKITNERLSRKRKRLARLRTKMKGGVKPEKTEYDAHVVRLTLREALSKGIISKTSTCTLSSNPLPSETYCLVLQWRLCSQWSITMSDGASYQKVAQLNQSRTIAQMKKSSSAKTMNDLKHVKLTTVGLNMHAESRTITANVNDDRYFQCPRCGRCNHMRNFYNDHGAKYGQIVGIKKVPTVGTDPDWMYTSSFKAARAALDPENYESFWNRSTRSHNEYRIPLDKSTVVKSTRAKAFNCNVQKVKQTDTFTIQSFNLHILLNQSSNELSPLFVITGTVLPNSKDSSASLLNLWQCITEEAIDNQWLDTQLTQARMLNLAGGRLVSSYANQSTNQIVANTKGKRGNPSMLAIVQYIKHKFIRSLRTDTCFTGMFLYWWECMATLGYDMRSRLQRTANSLRKPVSLSIFMLDIQQTPDGNNFIPNIMTPPHGDIHRVIWDPYSKDSKDEPYLLFSVAIKVQCRISYSDAFYVLRMQQNAHSAPLFICHRSRVRSLIYEGITTFDEARAMYRKSKTHKSTETEHMYMSAFLYCKLYKQMVDAMVYKWIPEPTFSQKVIRTTGICKPLDTFEKQLLIQGLNTIGFNHSNTVTYNASTYQIQQLVFNKKKKQLWLPVTMHWDDACVPILSSRKLCTYVSYEEAVQCLNLIASILKSEQSWSIESNVVDTFGRVTTLRLCNKGYLPIEPCTLTGHENTPITVPFKHTMDTNYLSVPQRSIRIHMKENVHHEYTQIWEHFIEVCDHLAKYFHQSITALDTTCPIQGSTTKPCLLYRLREQINKLLRSPPDTFSKSFRHTLVTDAKYSRTLFSIIEQCVLYANVSMVRNMILEGNTVQLHSLLIDTHGRYLSTDAYEAIREEQPNYAFPAARTEDMYMSQYRESTDILFKSLLEHSVLQQLQVDEHMFQEEDILFLPEPWQASIPQSRMIVRDGFTFLAETTSVKKQYLTEIKNKAIVSFETLKPFLKFPVYILNEPMILRDERESLPKIPNGDKLGTVMYCSTLHDHTYLAHLSDDGRILCTPDVPAYFMELFHMEKAHNRPLHLIYQHEQRPIQCKVVEIRMSADKQAWHTFILKRPIKLDDTPHTTPIRQRNSNTWHLDAHFYHVARYHLVKHKRQSKIKNILPSYVEKLLGNDTPWLHKLTSTPKVGRFIVVS